MNSERMKRQIANLIAVAALLLATGCATTREPVPTVAAAPAAGTGQVAEATLLDVAVIMFEFDELTDVDLAEQRTDTIIHAAEAHYMAHHLAGVLADSGEWGMVHTLPEDLGLSEVWVTANILFSSSRKLSLFVHAGDCTGRQLMAQDYSISSGQVAGTGVSMLDAICQQIAADLSVEQAWFNRKERQRMRDISRLKLAGILMPKQYGRYLQRDEDKRISIVQMPSEDDPMLVRIDRVSARLDGFGDLVRDHYDGYYEGMHEDYLRWRKELQKAATPPPKQSRTARFFLSPLAFFGLDPHSRRLKKWQQEFVDDTVATYARTLSPVVLEFEEDLYTLYVEKDKQMKQWRSLLERVFKAETGFDDAEPDSAL
jgi:hypothetical protein